MEQDINDIDPSELADELRAASELFLTLEAQVNSVRHEKIGIHIPLI